MIRSEPFWLMAIGEFLSDHEDQCCASFHPVAIHQTNGGGSVSGRLKTGLGGKPIRDFICLATRIMFSA